MGFENPETAQKAAATRKKKIEESRGIGFTQPQVLAPGEAKLTETEIEHQAFKREVERTLRKKAKEWIERVDWLLHNGTREHTVQARLAGKILDKLYPDAKQVEKPTQATQAQGVTINIGANLDKLPIEVKATPVDVGSE